MAGQSTNDKDLPVLIILEGPLRGQQWVMRGDELLIGRGGHCDIVLPERRVSREHVRIWRGGAGYYIEDLNSKNGTCLNAERLQGQQELHEGDEVQIALCVKLKFIGSEATVPLTVDELEAAPTGLALNPHRGQVMSNGRHLEPQLSL